MSEQLRIVETLEQLEQLAIYLQDKEYVAFDSETTGVVKESEIIGFSVAAEVDVGYYVILSYWDPKQKKLIKTPICNASIDICRLLQTKKLIMQNSPFDCWMVENNFGIKLMPSVVHDTLIGGHLLNENRSNALKERGVELYGEDARKEQMEMKESVYKNGGVLTKEKYELYKADRYLMAKYGAKDAILTLKIFYNDVPELFEQKLDRFFYDDESMPLVKGPTYDLNTTGLRVNAEKLALLKQQLEAELLELKSFIYKEIGPHVAKKYPGTSKAKTFNINAGKQLSWLLFFELGNDFYTLTDSGKEVCKFLDLRMPYSARDRRIFVREVTDNLGRVYCESKFNPKTGKMSRPKKIGNPWDYTACGKKTLKNLEAKYTWVKKLLEYKKSDKLLGTYVIGIQSRMVYNIIRPSFLQHGTTSGRYSSKAPNFQNLPRDDKRVKACIEARPGKVFVGADYSQLEPRVFASRSGDETLQGSFAKGEDFYSVVGAPIYEKTECSLFKDAPDSFAKKYPRLRDLSKIIALAIPYGRIARQLAIEMGISTEEAQVIIDKYFEAYPKVEMMMLAAHEQAKTHGVVYNLFGRPRRIPAAKRIRKVFGNLPHSELPYEARTLLNLGMNHEVQSTGASVMNRAAIAFWVRARVLEAVNALWKEVKIVLQVHDELIVEAPTAIAEDVRRELKAAMENTTQLPGVILVAEPKIAYNLADLK